MFQRILVPLDGSLPAEHPLPIAARIARATGGSLHLVRVVSPLMTMNSSDTHFPFCDLFVSAGW